VLAYLLALTAFTVLAGGLGDRIGRRRLLLAATAMFMITSAACSLAPTLAVLLMARAAQGLAAAGMTALALALVHDVVPASATGRTIGLLGTMSAIGTTLGPSLGGMLTARFGWEAIFLVNVPIGVVALLIGFRHLPDQPPSARPAFDFALMRSRTVAAGLVANALVSTVMMTTLIVGPFHLARALGLGVADTGLALSVGPLVAAMTGVPAGGLIDRFGATRMTTTGLLGLGTAACVVGMLPLSAGVASYLLAIGAMTAAYAVFQAANNTHLMATIDPRTRGAAAGLLGFTRNLGLIAGASVMGSVFAWAAGPTGVSDASPDAVAAGVRITFRIAALLIGLAIGAVLFGNRLGRQVIAAKTSALRSQTVVPGLLVLLGIVPAVAGMARLAELWGDPVVTALNARFVAHPLPVVLHILSVIPYSLLGAVQFAPAFSRNWPVWHRWMGRLLMVPAIVSALTGLWMAHFYPWPPLDGYIVYVERLVFGMGMLVALIAGLVAVRRRDFGAHGRWMLRAYAIGMGAGTQVLTHLPWLTFAGELTETTRAIAMGAGWVINVVIAEVIIHVSSASPRVSVFNMEGHEGP
jgi:MFS family permease